MDLDNSAMIKLLKTYNSFGRTLNCVQKWAGIFPDTIMTVSSRLLALVQIAILVMFMCGHLVYCYHCRADFSTLMAGLGWLLGFISVVIKTSILTTHRKILADLDVSLSAVFDRDLEDVEFRCIMMPLLRWFYWPSMALALSIWILFTVAGIKPLLVMIIQRIKGTEAYVYLLPFLAMIYPWNVDPHTWRYSVTLALELYVMISCAILASLPDLLFGYYVFQICGQLRVLAHRLRYLTTSGNYEENLRLCVDHYQRIARCRDYLDRIWGPMILWITLSNALIICLLVYRFLHAGKPVDSLVYILVKIGQTFIYGWFGTCLTIEVIVSDNLRVAIYSSDWPGSGEKRLMNDVFIMLMYRPFVLTAWGLSTLSVEMFVTVTNTAFSYYCMMRAIEE